MSKSQKLTNNRYANGRQLVWALLRGSRRYFVLSILMTMGMAFLDLLNPKIIGHAVDILIGEHPSLSSDTAGRLLLRFGGESLILNRLWLVALLICAVALAAAVCRYLLRILNTLGAERFLCRTRDALFEQILALPYPWHAGQHTGDIIQRCTSDVETVKRFVSEQISGFFRIIIMVSLAVWFMRGIHPRLTLAAVAFFPVIVGYSVVFRQKISGAFRNADEQEGRLSAIAQENLTGVRVVRAFGREQFERERFEKQNQLYTDLWVHLMRILNLFWCSGDLISGLQVLTVTALGARFCVSGSLSAGGFVAFVAYNAMLIWPVRQLGRVISEMSKAGISVERIRFIMNAQREEDRQGAIAPRLNGEIRFEHVTFAYPDGGKNALNDVSFSVKPGETLGILGGTGSGKSTVVQLLLRLYDLPENGGRITVSGTDIRDMRADSLRSQIGCVLQEPFLFSRSLEDNIAISAPDATRPDIEAAASTAHLSEAVARFTDGYSTRVGERGVTLSGGQKQRAAIAQMLIRKPPVMIFDDSLSAVDAQTDEKIRRALKEKTRGATVILIAHRITTLMQADHILVMHKGRVAEEGTHQSLLKLNGRYKKVFDLQTEGLDALQKEGSK
ncbi:MAG: ABC transporter ATP-binding protein [Clostridia bacterium]|nr:ABC transporter ATP-binding protein [Clostridia bacterium]